MICVVRITCAIQVFSSLEEGAELMGLPKYQPAYLMGDAHKGICSAKKTFWPETKRIQCYYHMKMAVYKQRGKLPCPTSDWKVVKWQIEQLHQAPTQEIFDVAAVRLIEEWEAKGWEKFADYFRETWLEGSPNW